MPSSPEVEWPEPTVVLGEFPCATDRRIVTIQSASVEVDEEGIITDLTIAIAKAGQYQIFLCAAQDSARISITVWHLPQDAPDPNLPGTVVCDEIVEFYDAQVDIVAGAMGVQGRFMLPEGPGRHRVLIATDPAMRAGVQRAEQDIFLRYPASDVRQQLNQLDGRERYDVAIRYVSPLPDEDDK
jgi:hypothetical protein